jgi:hypothetical protein
VIEIVQEEDGASWKTAFYIEKTPLHSGLLAGQWP